MRKIKKNKWLKPLLLTVMGVLLTGVAFSGCSSCKSSGDSSSSDSDNPQVIKPFEPTISLNKSEMTLILGDEASILPTYTNVDGWILSYQSENEAVVKISDTGIITAYNTGKTNVKAVYGNGTEKIEALCAVTVTMGDYKPVLEVNGGLDAETNIKVNKTFTPIPYIQFNGKKFNDVQCSYKIVENPDVVSVSETGEITGLKVGKASIEMSATWRGMTASDYVALKRIFVININNDCLFTLNGEAVEDLQLYTLETFEEKSYIRTMDFAPSVTFNGAEVNANLIGVEIADNNIVNIANGKITAKSFGTTEVRLTYENGGRTYDESLTVAVIRPVAKKAGTVALFSTLDGTYKDAANGYANTTLATYLYGENREIYDAMQDGKPLRVTDNCIYGVKSNNLTDVGTATVVVGTTTECYEVTLETYAKVIQNGEDLLALQMTDTNAKIDGYVELLNNIDATSVTLTHNTEADSGFIGTFEGNGYSIYNLNIGNGAGLFGKLGNSAVIQNVALLQVTVNKGFYFASNSANYTINNVYIKVSEESKNPRGFSKMGNSQIANNVIVEYTGKNAIKVPTANEYTGWDTYGVLFGSVYYYGDFNYATDDKFKNVYAISPSLLMYASLESFYVYGANETTDVWNRGIGDGTKGVSHNFADEEKYNPSITKEWYRNIPMRNTRHYDSYLAMANDSNELSEFDSNYWVVSNGAVYWKSTYEKYLKVVATDVDGKDTDNFELNKITDRLTLNLADTTALNDVNYTILDGDQNLINENGTFRLTADATSGEKFYTVKLSATVNGIPVEKIIQIKSTLKATVYAQKVMLSTMDNTFDFGTTNFTLADKTLVNAYINNVSITLDGNSLPVISMKYYKDFTSESWGHAKGRVTYMDILVGDTVIVDNKPEDEPITLRIMSETQAWEFTNVTVCTKVLKTAQDLEIFNHLALHYGGKDRTGYYLLGNNIDAGQADIFHNYDDSIAFTGTFDGQGYTISNLNVSKTAVESTAQGKKATSLQTGLFGVIEGGCVKNVGFVNVNAQDGSVLGKVMFAQSNFGDDTLLQGTNKYFGSTFENIYIQVASNVTQTQGMLALVQDKMHLTKNIVIEYNPTNPAMQTNGYGSFIGSLSANNFKQEWAKSNLYVLSSVALGYVNNTAIVAGTEPNATTVSSIYVKHYTNRQSLIEAGLTYTLNEAYWTTTSGAPVWNTANWQSV